MLSVCTFGFCAFSSQSHFPTGSQTLRSDAVPTSVSTRGRPETRSPAPCFFIVTQAAWKRSRGDASRNGYSQNLIEANSLLQFLNEKLRARCVLDDVVKKAKEYLNKLPKELVAGSRLKQQVALLSNLGDVLVAKGKLPEALDAYQQSLTIAKRLAEQGKSNGGWQWDLSVSYEKLGVCWGLKVSSRKRWIPTSKA